MIKFKERERQLVFILVVLVMFALTFKLGYMTITAKSDKIEEQNMNLTAKLNDLNVYIEKEDDFRASMATFAWQSDAVKAKYGVGNTPEKTIIFLNDIEKITGIKITQINFGETFNVGEKQMGQEAEQQAAEQADADGQATLKAPASQEGVYLFCSPVTVNYTASYSSLKQAIDKINGCVERMTIESITAAYDMGTGKLSGSFTLNMYAITGTDKKYKPPVIEDINIGQPLPFGVN